MGPRPPVGRIIAWKRRPVLVVRVHSIPVEDWKQSDHDDYDTAHHWHRQGDKSYPSKEEWRDRPYAFWVRPAGDPAPVNDTRNTKAYGVRPFRRIIEWFLLPTHYAVCAECQELAPCLHHTAKQVAERAAKQMDEQLSVMPGCCWGCQEPITKRQRSIAFDGDNLEVPGGIAVVFHTRDSCAGAARRYEDKWVSVDATRRRRLRCLGQVTHHFDGDECSEGAGCTGGMVPHRSVEDHRWLLRRPDRVAALERRGADLLRGHVGECVRCLNAFARGEWKPEAPLRGR